jgi:hypothetical protein
VIGYYALGGGLGHLTRARRVLCALDLDAVLITASPYADDPRVVGDSRVLRVPRRLGHDRAAFRAWLSGLRFDELIVDSFPGGILGELCGMALPPARVVARRLDWEAYAARLDGALPHYEVAYRLEPLSAAHERELAGCARRIEPLALPVCEPGPPLLDEPHWLVVHSGAGEELEVLMARAADAPRVVVVSPRRPARLPANAVWRDVYPVAPHLPHAERIVSGAGFNLMAETAALRERHTAVPFPRALDDQYARL